MGIIKNRSQIATSPLREIALDIIEAGIERVLPSRILREAVTREPDRIRVGEAEYPLPGGRVFVIGGGKAAGLMADALERILGVEQITAGVVNDKGSGYKTKKIRVITAGHPMPDRRGWDGVREMLDLKTHFNIGAGDIVFCLLSGGGSALMPCPVPGVTLKEKQKITGLLLRSGADIGEVNIVRKHLSRTKGGQLGSYFAPAEVVSLILSDVIGDDLSSIASGPTYPDTSTFGDAYGLLERYGLLSTAPRRVVAYLEKGCRGEVPETPVKLENCHNHIIGNNRLALEAMSARAREYGLRVKIATAEQKGETGTVALTRAGEILHGIYSGYDAVMLGGETTPRLPEKAGRGGRNQHYAVVTMRALRERSGRWVMASVGTDGSDFLPDIAGAIVDEGSSSRAEALVPDVPSYIERYDSYPLLKQMGDSLVITGNTGTNVGDVIVYLLE